MDDEEQDTLTLDDKNKQCSCMGENALRQNSCNFPGLGEYYDEAIDQNDPLKPAEPGPQPAEPQLPPAPDKPADVDNVLLLAVYQATCFTVIRYLAFDMPGGNEEKLFFFITEFLLIVAGAMMYRFSLFHSVGRLLLRWYNSLKLKRLK